MQKNKLEVIEIIYNEINRNKLLSKNNKVKTTSLYLDYKDVKSYVGEGIILEKTNDYQPVYFKEIDNNIHYYRARRCLCEIVTSKNYPKGFRKHFYISFKLPSHLGIRYFDNIFNKQKKNKKYGIINDILIRTNYHFDYIEEIQLKYKLKEILKKYKTKSNIPPDIWNEIKLEHSNLKKLRNEVIIRH